MTQLQYIYEKPKKKHYWIANKIFELLGGQYSLDGDYRFWWGEVSFHWGISASLSQGWDDDGEKETILHLNLVYLTLYIYLPDLTPTASSVLKTTYGFRWRWEGMYESELFLYWGKNSKIFRMPWYPCHIVTEVLQNNLTWCRQNYSEPSEIADASRYREKGDYFDIDRDSEPRRVEATLEVRRQHRCQMWLLWTLPFTSYFLSTVQYIDVSFSEEVGSGSGSWKGGVLACSYEMKFGETPIKTLRRMNKERAL